MFRRIFVIGVRFCPGFALSAEAGKRLSESDVILTSRRILDDLSNNVDIAGHNGPCGLDWEELRPKVKVIDKVDETVSFLRGISGKASVLASGDPLFFGIGGVLAAEFPREEVEVYPALSSMQLAFARIGRPWEDAFFVSLHGRKKRHWQPEDLPLLAGMHQKLMILTGGEGRRPRDIAPHLPGDCRVFVFERIGYPDENLVETTPAELERANRVFSEPNLLIVEPARRDDIQGAEIAFGLGEDEFEHDGLITKDEIRAALLHKLRLPREGVLWDIGAGSGSVGIEAKRLCPGLKVYAVEKNRKRAEKIALNCLQLSAGAINVVEGEAPKILAGLPAPQRVVIGGGGGELIDIIKAVSGAMGKGIVVIPAITLESIREAMEALKGEGFAKLDAASVAVSRMTPVGDRNYMKALNPVFLIRGSR
ncbi:MAG: precorrin-6y C5,15-methyltransferase (decarboxylating) subunit CbiE [Nitrospiraceae bacterium]|nr:precorrin-6y C5,15-methyltransferase (decarboxylating) subunit CbiE [Nitrospiraceae bacterium]